jgi:hypothetical protein
MSRAAAETLHGCAVTSATVTSRTTVDYDPYLAGRFVERVRGLATTPDGDSLRWSAIVKHTTGGGLRAARRELTAYRAGIAPATPGAGLRAPRLLAWSDEFGEVELWLEELTDQYAGRWHPERFAIAAEHIAGWNAEAAAVPAGFDALDGWAEQHGQPHRLPTALAELAMLRTKPWAAEAMAELGDDGFDRTEALIRSAPKRVDGLSGFPQTLLHHDLVRSNLFAISGAMTAAIDWEYAGPGPLGVDLAPLVIGSIRRGEASVDDLAEIESGVLGGYESVVQADIRTPYRLAVGLRWHVVLGTIRARLDPTSQGMRGSRPDEPRIESLRHLLGLSRHILAVSEDT